VQVAVVKGLRSRTRAWATRVAHLAGFELVRQHFYSPIPDYDRLESSHWSDPLPSSGVDLRVESAVSLLTTELAAYLAELSSSSSPLAGFAINNGSYESVDAESLYAMLRHVKPSRVFELGSGSSSHVITAARTSNAADGSPFEHQVFDPYPFTASPLGPVPASEVHAVRTEDIPVSVFEQLAAGDVLFVDTTHTVKSGGDVNKVVLEILPTLASGVVIHFHDIFLPYEYPRDWIVEHRRLWAEQYLLQAFLAFNDEFEVMFPAYAVSRAAPDEVARLIPTFGPAVAPGAFWIVRR
jgi:Methyltransferase domain